MATIRVKPEELETVAKHVPDAEDACRRARTSLSWELPSLVMEIPGIGSAAIHELTDELLHWLRRYEEKLNEAEELLYRTAAAIRQADQTLADNMKEFGLELLGWYDVQRLFGEYDPITGERISGWDRLVAGGMLLASFVPPVKGAGVAGKAAVKGAKAAGIAADVSKWISKTRNVLNVNKIKGALQTIYHQVIKGPITETIRSFKHQWENFLENVGSVLMGPQPALAGVGGPAPRMWVSGAEREAKGTMMNIVGKNGDEVVGKGTGNGYKYWNKTTVYKNVKVYQRDDIIDPYMKDARGRTNLERMEKGLAPLGPDGKPINLHHMTQRNESSIAEVTQTFHKENSKIIHINSNTIPSGINRNEFDKWRKDYWKHRVSDFK